MADPKSHRVFGYPAVVTDLSINTQGLAASNSRLGYVFSVPEDCTVSHIGVRQAGITGTSPVYRVSLQTVGSTGVPTTTLVAVGAEGTFTPDGTSNFVWVSLTTPCALTAGSVVSVVIDYSSGTISGAAFATFGTTVTGPNGTTQVLPYFAYAAAGTYSKQANSQQLLFGYKSSTKVYGFPATAVSTTSVSSSGHRVAFKFSTPDNGATYKVSGLRFNFTSPSSSNTFVVGVWDSAGTALQSVTVDSDHLRANTTTASTAEVYFSSPLATLDAGTTYYAGLQRVGTNVNLSHIEVLNNEDLDPFAGGRDCCLATWDGSSWTNLSTKRPHMELILSDVTGEVGGSNSSWLSLLGVGA